MCIRDSYDTYRTKDGRYLAVAGLEPKFWQGFCRAIDRPDLEGFPAMSMDGQMQPNVKAEIAVVIEQRSLVEWQTVFAPLDVCVEAVLTIEEALAHPQSVERGLIVEVPQPDGTCQRQVASPFRFSGSQAQYRHIGVEAGQDTDAVLAEIDYSVEEIASLRERGIVC